jgi:hypothetical protein
MHSGVMNCTEKKKGGVSASFFLLLLKLAAYR